MHGLARGVAHGLASDVARGLAHGLAHRVASGMGRHRRQLEYPSLHAAHFDAESEWIGIRSGSAGGPDRVHIHWQWTLESHDKPVEGNL
jgi:hypothetical protein